MYSTEMNAVIEVFEDKGKAVLLQARKGPQGSRKLRFPDFKTVGTGRW